MKEFQFCNTALLSKDLSTCILKFSWNTKNARFSFYIWKKWVPLKLDWLSLTEVGKKLG